MKLWFSVLGLLLALLFLGALVVKLKDPAMTAIMLLGVALMVIDGWQARNEPDK
jgi:hypothetical protein